MKNGEKLSRDIPIELGKSAILFIDVQYNNVYPDGGQYKGLSPLTAKIKYQYFFDTLHNIALPNMVKIQKKARKNRIEILYTTIESLTSDGRDRGLDYKISGFNIPKNSKNAKIAKEIKPKKDEMIFKKTSSSPFISTNLHYVLGNLNVKYLIICGLLSDQCISSTVRDACDLGYFVTLISDTCTTYSKNRHEDSLNHIKGYCRQRTTNEFLKELKSI